MIIIIKAITVIVCVFIVAIFGSATIIAINKEVRRDLEHSKGFLKQLDEVKRELTRELDDLRESIIDNEKRIKAKE